MTKPAGFLWEGATYTLDQMLVSNRDDAAFCEWARAAQPGDRFEGCEAVPWRAITAEDWDYWLGCMPPCKWQAVAGGEAFHCMELLNFDLAIWCVRLGDDYYRVDASPRLAPQAVADLVALAKSPA